MAAMARIQDLKKDNSILLIDSSYFVFYRYYATCRWFSFRQKGVNNPAPLDCESLMQNPEFLEAFTNQAYKEVTRLIRQWGSCPENVVFCCDCPRANIWRMGLADAAYKGTREAPANFAPGIFSHFFDRLNNGDITGKRSYVDGLEADDVVYGWVRALRSESHSEFADVPIYCISNDNDYLQLRRFDNVHVYNLGDKNLADRSCGCPEKDLLVKVLCGDKSDNIPPCAAGVGPKTALKLAGMSAEDREAWLRKKGGDAAVAMAEANRRLIDFRCIPEGLLQKLNLD